MLKLIKMYDIHQLLLIKMYDIHQLLIAGNIHQQLVTSLVSDSTHVKQHSRKRPKGFCAKNMAVIVVKSDILQLQDGHRIRCYNGHPYPISRK